LIKQHPHALLLYIEDLLLAVLFSRQALGIQVQLSSEQGNPSLQNLSGATYAPHLMFSLGNSQNGNQYSTGLNPLFLFVRRRLPIRVIFPGSSGSIPNWCPSHNLLRVSFHSTLHQDPLESREIFSFILGLRYFSFPFSLHLRILADFTGHAQLLSSTILTFLSSQGSCDFPSFS